MSREYFLKLDGIRGDSNKPGYNGWIELVSFNFGDAQAPPNSSSSSRRQEIRPTITDLHFIAQAGSSSAKLSQAANNGIPIAHAVFESRTEGRTKHLTAKMSDVFVSPFAFHSGGVNSNAFFFRHT